MKYSFVLFFVIGITCCLNSQISPDSNRLNDIQYITELCYEEELSQRIRITSKLDTSTLSKLDKLKLTKKRYNQNHHEYLNDSAHVVHDRKFVSHQNMFPEWYTHPTKIRSNQNGIISFFDKDNEYLEEGWTGGAYDTTQHGIYHKRSGDRIYEQEYSATGNARYEKHDSMVQNYGLLYRYVYGAPTNQELNKISNNGFTVEVDSNLITVKNDTVRYVWDIENKIFANQYINNGEVDKTIKKYYTYYSFADEFLMTKRIAFKPKSFTNGDCYDVVTVANYKNYSNNCNQIQDSSSKVKNIENKVEEILIYPNPTSGYITIKIPESDQQTNIYIYSLAGNPIVSKTVDPNISIYEMNISNFTAGMYIIRVEQGGNVYSSKIIKQ